MDNKKYKVEKILTNILEELEVNKYEWDCVQKEITTKYNDKSEKTTLTSDKENKKEQAPCELYIRGV